MCVARTTPCEEGVSDRYLFSSIPSAQNLPFNSLGGGLPWVKPVTPHSGGQLTTTSLSVLYLIKPCDGPFSAVSPRLLLLTRAYGPNRPSHFSFPLSSNRTSQANAELIAWLASFFTIQRELNMRVLRIRRVRDLPFREFYLLELCCQFRTPEYRCRLLFNSRPTAYLCAIRKSKPLSVSGRMSVPPPCDKRFFNWPLFFRAMDPEIILLFRFGLLISTLSKVLAVAIQSSRLGLSFFLALPSNSSSFTYLHSSLVEVIPNSAK